MSILSLFCKAFCIIKNYYPMILKTSDLIKFISFIQHHAPLHINPFNNIFIEK